MINLMRRFSFEIKVIQKIVICMKKMILKSVGADDPVRLKKQI